MRRIWNIFPGKMIPYIPIILLLSCSNIMLLWDHTYAQQTKAETGSCRHDFPDPADEASRHADLMENTYRIAGITTGASNKITHIKSEDEENKDLRVATCQFSVGAEIAENARQIRQYIKRAKELNAHIVHFPEYALCGYPGKDFESWQEFDWDALLTESVSICSLAAQQNIWVVLGSAHRLSGENFPHNSLYVIDSQGEIVDRYDKRFCSPYELKHFTPGKHFCVFTIRGVRCGLLICADSRYPELYREYKKLEIDLLLQSFHIARAPGPNNLAKVIPATMQTRAASNYFWISAPNSSALQQVFPSMFIRPDGIIADTLTCNLPGIMVNTVSKEDKYYDASAPFRDKAMSGVLHNGTLIQDERSKDRKKF